jgi:DNA-binding NarL/FixJ family response regulator
MADLPIRVAVLNDYEVVVAGLAAMLARFPDRVQVCEPVLRGEPVPDDDVDVVLYDTYGRANGSASTIELLAGTDGIGAVAVFTMVVTDDVVHDALSAGARAVLSKGLTGEELVDALVRIARGEEVVRGLGAVDRDHPGGGGIEWPGREVGLSLRESEVLALLADGRSNREISTALYVSEQTVKSHLKSIYRKLGVTNRTQAAGWAHEHRL